jgi:hypothetical protein
MSWADQPPQAPWRQQAEALRAAAPPEVRRRLLPVPPEPTDEGEATLQDRVIGCFVPAEPPRPSPEEIRRAAALPAVLHDVPCVESHPWLSHTFLEKLEIELTAVGLWGKTTDDDAAGGETSEGDQEGAIAVLGAQVNEVNKGLSEFSEEIRQHLPEWTEHRNMTLAVRAAFDDTR